MFADQATIDAINEAMPFMNQPRLKDGTSVCAKCHSPHVKDLRPWPPDNSLALRYCGQCRLEKALRG